MTPGVLIGGSNGPSGASVTIEQAATFAGISASQAIRYVLVAQDETNAGAKSLYFYDGVSLNWVITQTI